VKKYKDSNGMMREIQEIQKELEAEGVKGERHTSWQEREMQEGEMQVEEVQGQGEIEEEILLHSGETTLCGNYALVQADIARVMTWGGLIGDGVSRQVLA
jgi:hypothetical protein